MSDKNFTIYKSSAGSGKTFTLVKEYLALALNDGANPPQAYKHILAVTFTNKAAAEMKERIIKALKELAADDYNNISGGTKTMLAALKEHKKLNAVQALSDDIIRKRAQRILTAILHNYSDFAIGTIDSFVQKVVRTFAFDLKIPMSFEIEMDDDKLLSQAIDLLLGKIGNDERLTKALIEYTESKTDDEKSWHIENDLHSFARNLLNEEGAVYIDKLRYLSVDDFFVIKDTLAAGIKKFESAIKKYGKDGIEIIKSAGVEHANFAGGANGIAKYFSYLAESRTDKLEPTASVQKNIAENKWYSAKATAADKAAIDSIRNKLTDIYNEAVSFVEQNKSEFILFTLINTNIYSLAVLNEIEKLIEEYKAENNVVHISEFNKMIAKVVLNEPIPFIYERLGERYNNYLIDEFQDTSVLQFQNLLPLIDNSLASGHFTMLVGDGKQAIYRWRGGEVEQFARLPFVFKHNDNELTLERQEALIRNHNPQVLGMNYRSKREVIEFNNDFFKTISGKLNENYQTIYQDLEQGFNPDNIGGLVQVVFIEEEKEEYREANRTHTLAIINKVIGDGFMLKDIAILVRKNTDGSDMANFLAENNIPVISSDSMLLSNSKEINFLHSLLKYLANPDDEIVFTELAEYLVASGLIKITLLHEIVAHRRTTHLSKLLKLSEIEFNVVHLSKMALYELCEELIRIFNLNASPNAYIQFFLDEVLNYSTRKNNNLNDFIEYWEEKRLKASLIVPQGMDAVTIMTIHRSKGLEFPVVIIPFLNNKVEHGKRNLWIEVENKNLPDLPVALVPTSSSLKGTPYAALYEEEVNKSLLDAMNVLYVALTRAEERMYILTGKGAEEVGELTNVSNMFAWYYQQKGEWQRGKTIYGETTVSYTTRKEDKRNPALNYQLSSFNSNQWRDNIKMRAAAPTIWNTEMIENKKQYGVMVHTALAKIKTEEDIISALQTMSGEGLINIEEKEKLETLLSSLIQHPELKPYFEQGLTVKNECEIISLDGDFFRPDRVVIKNKEAVIIDYKTGNESPKHKQQIIEYADLMIEMGYEVKKKLLVYIEENKVVKC